MKTHKLPSIIAGCLCSLQFATADIIVMKNGDEVEGRVLREEGDNYVLEVKFSSTIREEKIVPKSDVKSIRKEEPDVKAFGKLEGLVPTPELLTIAGYEKRIESIEEFIKANPKSGKVPKAKEMLDVLGEELKTVREGGIKFGEEMVPGDDYMANAYEFDAKIAESQIKEAVARRDFLSALRQFSAYEKKFGDADGRASVVSLITQVLKAYGASIDESLANLESRLAKRQAGLVSMTPEDRGKTQRALDEESSRIATRFGIEKAALEPWITPDTFHKESLDEAKRQVDSEATRLGNKQPDTALTQPVAESYRVAWGKVGGGTDEEKSKAIDEARTNKVPDVYLEKLRDRAGLKAN